MNEIDINLDLLQNVLYVKRAYEITSLENEMPYDSYLVLSYNLKKDVVGLKIIDVHEMNLQEWMNHLDRKWIPSDILEVVDEYFMCR